MSRIVIFLFLICLGTMSASAQTRFFSLFDDVPLVDGLVELQDRSIVFDQPQGRIAEAAAVAADLQPVQLYEFYDQTLPQLGWEKMDGGAHGAVYQRGAEKMTLSATYDGRQTILKILLEPR